MKKIWLKIFSILILIVLYFSFSDQSSKPNQEIVNNRPKSVYSNPKKNKNWERSASKTGHAVQQKISQNQKVNQREKKTLIKASPVSNSKQLNKAIELLSKGEIQAAEAILKNILEKEPDNIEALTELGMIYIADYQDPTIGRNFLEKALGIDNDNEIVVGHLLSFYENHDDIKGGIEFFKSLEPDSPLVNYALGQLHAQAGDNSQSIELFENVLKDPLSNSSMAADIAESYVNSGEDELAIKAYRMAIIGMEKELKNQPYNEHNESHIILQERIIDLQLDLVLTHIRKGNIKEASKILPKLKAMRPYDDFIGQLEQYLNQQS